MYINMVINREPCFEESVQIFMEALTSADFQRRIGKPGHYDFSHCGMIVYTAVKLWIE